MLKLSRTGIGLLSAQYRSVLKKCFFLNLAAAGIIACSSPAAAEVVHGYLNAGDPTVGGLLNDDFGNLINGDGTGDSIHNADGVVAQGLAMYGNNIAYRVNNFSQEAWIRNEGTIGIGYSYTSDYTNPTWGAYPTTTTISNVHSVSESNRVNAGSVLMNNDITHTYNEVPFNGYKIEVQNAVFSQNTRSSFSDGNSDVYGGVIGNVRDSDTQNKMNITNSTFSQNYAMSNKDIKGGVVYNGSVETQYGTSEYKASNAYIYSTSNTYSNNGAYNNNLGVTSGQLYDDVVKAWVENYNSVAAANAYGGVIYNESTFESSGDTYNNNKVVAMENAQGGAIYNTIATYAQSAAAGGDTWTTQGVLIVNDGTFRENSVSGGDLSDSLVAGGAIANIKGTATIGGDDIFYENVVQVGYAGEGMGGAVVNDGTMTFSGTQNFENNEVYTDSHSKSYGGAVANLSGAMTFDGTQTFLGNKSHVLPSSVTSVEYTEDNVGGAIASLGGTVENVATGTQTYSGNKAGLGGAIYNASLKSSASFTNAGSQVFASNSAGLNGGAVYNAATFINTGTQEFTYNSAVGKIGVVAGGAVYNSGTYTGLSGDFKNNWVKADAPSSDLGHDAYGGAIYNEGTITMSGTQNFEGNHAQNVAEGSTRGGAIYNAVNGAITGVAGSFKQNEVSGNNYAYGGAIYNDGTLTAGETSFTTNSATSAMNGASGGAVYNASNGTLTLGADSSFTSNQAVLNTVSAGLSGDALGGAVYNAGALNLSSTGFNSNSVISNATNAQAARGGAIYNAGTGTITFADNAIQNFESNSVSLTGLTGSALVSGGAIYNAANGTINKLGGTFKTNTITGSSADGSNATGGAVYNGGTITMSATQTFEQNSAITTANTAFGGAIYNDTDGTINGISGIFKKNQTTANAPTMGGVDYNAYGGAIYNKGSLSLSATEFEQNSASGKSVSGGAVYNDTTGTINVSGGTFKSNIITAADGTASGGAIYNANSLSFSSLATQTFEANQATSTDGLVYGGAIYNDADGNINGLSGDLKSNAATTNTVDAYAGAIYNAGTLTAGNLKFTSNLAKSRDESSYGGAVYNSGTMSAIGEFTSNKADGYKAFGGAIYSTKALTLNDNSKFEANTAAGRYEGRGGALMLDGTSGDTTILGTTFTSNQVTTNLNGWGGAIYNVNNNTLTTLADVSLTGNSIVISEDINQDYYAYGGAIYNNTLAGNISRMEITSIDKNVSISNNAIAVSTAASAPVDNFFGGAIYNGENANMLISTISDAHTLSINGNEARYGGAIYNKANGANVNVGGIDYSASLSITSIGGNININQNRADEQGGALYNNVGSNGTTTFTASSATMNIAGNVAGDKGGAIYNDVGSTVLLQTGDGGKIRFVENMATVSNGGAIYNNAAKLVLSNAAGTLEHADYHFGDNSAVKGAAIYNATKGSDVSSISGNLKNTSVVFEDNVATGGQGGALYNDNGSTVELNLSGNANVTFKTTKDDVYNLGVVTFTGDSSDPVIPSASSVATFADETNATSVVLNSTFGGTGQYNVSNTNLKLGSTGYIDYDPIMQLKNNVITMDKKSYINLSAKDNIVNNDFNIAKDAVLTYNASDAATAVSDVVLANTINNAGTVNVADNVLTTVSVNTLNSDNGTIKIDVHDAKSAQNPLKADVITINNRIYGTTNVVFDNSNNVVMSLNDRIYFAKTQGDQQLSDYKFNVLARNPDYNIYLGHEANGAVYDWFLYRRGFEAQEVAYLDLPRAAIEQTRSLSLHINRTNRGECNCHQGACDNRVYCNYRSSAPKLRLWATPFYRSGTYDKPVETDFKLKGLEVGLDYQPTYSDLFGIFGSYRDGRYEHDGRDKTYYSEKGYRIDMTSKLFGVYYRKYIGDLYMVGALYGGENKADIKGDNGVTASTKGLDVGGFAEIGYDIRTSKHSLLTPSLKATYDYIRFDDATDDAGGKAKFDDVHDLELEAALKFEYEFNNEYELPTTGYIKPSIIKTIENGGKVTIDNVKYNDTLEDETIGRIEIGGDTELIEDTFSVGAFGNYSFGSGYKAWGVGGNVRLVW